MSAAAPPHADAVLRSAADPTVAIDVLDRHRLDGLAELAASICDTWFATVFVVDEQQRRHGGTFGGDLPTDLPLEGSPSGRVLATRAPLIVEDQYEHPDFPVPASPDRRGYCGVPILDADGVAVGGVCVVADVARSFTGAHLAALTLIADQAAALFDAARTVERLARAHELAAERDADLALERGRLAAVLGGLHDGIVLDDEDERIVLVNQAFADDFRIPVPPAMLVGGSGVEAKAQCAMLFDDPDAFLTRVYEVMAAGERVIGDEVRTLDGRVIERDYIPIAVDGERRGHCWQFRDITARYTAEREAAAAGRQIDALADTQPGAIFRIGPDGRLVSETREAAEIYGTEVPFPDVIHEEDRARVLAGIAEQRAKPAPGCVEYRVRPAPGVVRHLEVRTTPLWDGDGAFDGFTGTIVDVTEARETAAALARSEAARRDEHERLAMTVEGALDCIVPLDPDGAVIDFNPAAESLFGVRREEAVGHDLGRFLAPGTYDPADLTAATGTRRLELVATHSSGRVFPVELAIATSVADDGTRRTTAFLRDVSALKDAEEQREQRLRLERTARRQAEAVQADLATRNDELRRLAQVKDDVLAGVSHELRTPLTSMRTFLEMLEEDPTLDATHREPIAVVSRNAARLQRVVADLLDLKDGVQDMPVADELVELRGIVLDASEGLRPRAEALGITLRTDPGNPVVARGDAARTGQVLDVLVDNALKFTPEGGTVALRTWDDGGRAYVEVKDTGRGIEPRELDRVFERFFQARAGLETGSGSGLGLAIAKLLVEAMGGSIEVESSEGVGTTFTLDLPLAG